MSTCRSFSRIAFLRSSASVRCGGLRPTTPGTIPARVNSCTRWPTSTWGSQPPDCTTCRKPLSLTWLTSRAISSTWPTIASSGCSARPPTRATVVPRRSTETSSANPSAASRHTRAGSVSWPGGPGAVSNLSRRSGAAIAERLAVRDGGLDRYLAPQAVGDVAVLVRGVYELPDALLARVARHGDLRPQRDIGDPEWLVVLRHHPERVVFVAHYVDPSLRGEVQEEQHLARGCGHHEQLLGVEDARIPVRFAGGEAHLLLGGRRRGRVGAVVAIPARTGGAAPPQPSLVPVCAHRWRIEACPRGTWSSCAPASRPSDAGTSTPRSPRMTRSSSGTPPTTSPIRVPTRAWPSCGPSSPIWPTRGQTASARPSTSRTSSTAASGSWRPGADACTGTAAGSRSRCPRPTRCRCATAGSCGCTSTARSRRRSMP